MKITLLNLWNLQRNLEEACVIPPSILSESRFRVKDHNLKTFKTKNEKKKKKIFVYGRNEAGLGKAKHLGCFHIGFS